MSREFLLRVRNDIIVWIDSKKLGRLFMKSNLEKYWLQLPVAEYFLCLGGKVFFLLRVSNDV